MLYFQHVCPTCLQVHIPAFLKLNFERVSPEVPWCCFTINSWIDIIGLVPCRGSWIMVHKIETLVSPVVDHQIINFYFVIFISKWDWSGVHLQSWECEWWMLLIGISEGNLDVMVWQQQMVLQPTLKLCPPNDHYNSEKIFCWMWRFKSGTKFKLRYQNCTEPWFSCINAYLDMLYRCLQGGILMPPYFINKSHGYFSQYRR